MNKTEITRTEAEAMELIKTIANINANQKILSVGISMLKQNYIPELVREVNNVLKTDYRLDVRDRTCFELDLAVISVKMQNDIEQKDWCLNRLKMLKNKITNKEVLKYINPIIENIIR